MVVGTWETGDNVHLGCQDNSTPAEHIFICHTTLIFNYSEIKLKKKNRKASEKQREIDAEAGCELLLHTSKARLFSKTRELPFKKRDEKQDENRMKSGRKAPS